MTDPQSLSQNPPPNPSTRRLVRLAVLGIVGVAVLYTAAWTASASILRRQVEQWIVARGAEGFVIQSTAPTLAGFPVRVAVRLEGLHLTVPAAKGGWTWTTDAVEVIGSPLRPMHIALDLTGTHRITGPWLPAVLQIQDKHAGLALTLDSTGRVETVAIDIDQADAGWENAAGHGLLHLDKTHTTFTAIATSGPTAAPTASSRLVLTADNLTLPDLLPPPLAQTVHKLDLTAEVVGPVTAGPLPQVLEAWRTAGGALNLKDFAVDWPPLYLAGDGTLALDENLQPMGAFTTHIRGFGAAIDVMTEQGKMRKNEAAVAKGVLGLMAKPAADNSGPEIAMPITVQNRMLSAGPMTLLQLPVVTWPAGPTP